MAEVRASIQEIVHPIVMTVHLNGMPTFNARLKAGLFLMRIAAKIIGMRFEVRND